MPNFSFLNYLKTKTPSGGGFTRVIIISLFATLACVGIIKAATTIGENISTGGTITGSGANTLYGATSIGGALTATSTLTVTGNSIFSTASSTGIVKFATINSDTGAISFGDENLSTTGTLSVTGLTTMGNASTTLLSIANTGYIGGANGLVLADGSITDASGAISFGDENLSTSGTIASTGANERVQGTNSFIDFDDGDNGGTTGFIDIGGLNGSYNESLRFDFNSTSNRAIITSPSSATLSLRNMGNFSVMDDADSDMYLATYYNNSSYGSEMWFRHSADTDISDGSYTAVETTDNYKLGGLFFQGVNSISGFATAASIIVLQDGAATADYVPAEILFATSAGSAGAATRLTIKPSGAIQYAPFTTMPTCNAGSAGSLVYDSDDTVGMCFCDGTAWRGMEYNNGSADIVPNCS